MSSSDPPSTQLLNGGNWGQSLPNQIADMEDGRKMEEALFGKSALGKRLPPRPLPSVPGTTAAPASSFSSFSLSSGLVSTASDVTAPVEPPKSARSDYVLNSPTTSAWGDISQASPTFLKENTNPEPSRTNANVVNPAPASVTPKTNENGESRWLKERLALLTERAQNAEKAHAQALAEAAEARDTMTKSQLESSKQWSERLALENRLVAENRDIAMRALRDQLSREVQDERSQRLEIEAQLKRARELAAVEKLAWEEEQEKLRARDQSKLNEVKQMYEERISELNQRCQRLTSDLEARLKEEQQKAGKLIESLEERLREETVRREMAEKTARVAQQQLAEYQSEAHAHRHAAEAAQAELARREQEVKRLEMAHSVLETQFREQQIRLKDLQRVYAAKDEVLENHLTRASGGGKSSLQQPGEALTDRAALLEARRQLREAALQISRKDAALSDALAESRREIARIESQARAALEDKNRELEQLREQLRKLNAHHEAALAEAEAEATRKQDVAKARVSQLESELDRLRAEMIHRERAWQIEREELQYQDTRRMRKIEEQMSAREDAIATDASKRLRSALADNARLSAELSEARVELERAQRLCHAETNKLKDALRRSQEELSVLRNSLSSLSFLEERFKELEADLSAQIETEKLHARDRTSEMSKLVQSVRDKKAELAALQAQSTSRLNVLRGEILTEERALAECRSELQQKEDELHRLLLEKRALRLEQDAELKRVLDAIKRQQNMMRGAGEPGTGQRIEKAWEAMRKRESLVVELGPITVTEMKQFVIAREQQYDKELYELTQRLTHCESELQKARAESAEKSAALLQSTASREVDVKRQVQTMMQAERAAQERDLLAEKIVLLERELQEQRMHADAAEQCAKERASRIGELEEELVQQQARAEKRVAEADGRVLALEEELRNLRVVYSQLKRDMESFTVEDRDNLIRTLRSRLLQSEADTQSAQAMLQKIAGEKKTLETVHKEDENTILDLRNQVEEWRNKFIQEQSLVQQARASEAAAIRELAEAVEAREKVFMREEPLKREIAALQAQRQMLMSQAAEHQRALAQASVERDRLNQTIMGLESRIASLEQECKTRLQQLRSAEEQTRLAKDQLMQMESEFHEAQLESKRALDHYERVFGKLVITPKMNFARPSRSPTHTRTRSSGIITLHSPTKAKAAGSSAASNSGSGTSLEQENKSGYIQPSTLSTTRSGLGLSDINEDGNGGRAQLHSQQVARDQHETGRFVTRQESTFSQSSHETTESSSSRPDNRPHPVHTGYGFTNAYAPFGYDHASIGPEPHSSSDSRASTGLALDPVYEYSHQSQYPPDILTKSFHESIRIIGSTGTAEDDTSAAARSANQSQADHPNKHTSQNPQTQKTTIGDARVSRPSASTESGSSAAGSSSTLRRPSVATTPTKRNSIAATAAAAPSPTRRTSVSGGVKPNQPEASPRRGSVTASNGSGPAPFKVSSGRRASLDGTFGAPPPLPGHRASISAQSKIASQVHSESKSHSSNNAHTVNASGAEAVSGGRAVSGGTAAPLPLPPPQPPQGAGSTTRSAKQVFYFDPNDPLESAKAASLWFQKQQNATIEDDSEVYHEIAPHPSGMQTEPFSTGDRHGSIAALQRERKTSTSGNVNATPSRSFKTRASVAGDVQIFDSPPRPPSVASKLVEQYGIPTAAEAAAASPIRRSSRSSAGSPSPTPSPSSKAAGRKSLTNSEKTLTTYNLSQHADIPIAERARRVSLALGHSPEHAEMLAQEAQKMAELMKMKSTSSMWSSPAELRPSSSADAESADVATGSCTPLPGTADLTGTSNPKPPSLRRSSTATVSSTTSRERSESR